MRWRGRNRWAGRLLCLSLLIGAAIAFGLLRVPIQVSDSLAEILEAQKAPSAAVSFANALQGAAYLRPLRIAQIKVLFDLADGHYYWLVYRGYHAALLLALLLLFSSCLRVQDAIDFTAATLALVVLCGLHTFLGFVREAFPINHFLEIAVLCVAALRIAQSNGGWLADAGGALLLAVGALTLESGLLVWVVIAAAWLSGLRGISTRGLVLSTGVCVAYLGLRFGYLDVGVPSLAERSSGYFLERLEPDELQRRFGSAPGVFYLYNVVSSVMSVLVSEPRAGVFIAARQWLDGEVLPRTYLALLSSLATTMLIGAWAVARCRARRLDSMPDRLAVVAVAVILANGVLSFAYTKDEVMAVGGVFYAFAAYAAMRATLSWAGTLRPPAALVAAALLCTLSAAWVVRAAAVDHALRVQAFNVRNDWADVTERLARNGHPQTDPDSVALVERLRRQALDAPVPNPGLLAEWHNRWLGD